MALSDDELSAMAIEELDQACSLIWPELVKITPEQVIENGHGLGRELFAGMRRNALTAEEGACSWL